MAGGHSEGLYVLQSTKIALLPHLFKKYYMKEQAWWDALAAKYGLNGVVKNKCFVITGTTFSFEGLLDPTQLEANNHLLNVCLGFLQDERFEDMFKVFMEKRVQDTLDWINENPSAERSSYEVKMAELLKPIDQTVIENYCERKNMTKMQNSRRM